ncbi:Hypothetical protein BIBO2_0475 [Brucella sp. BO2]|nr:Hypothetical protein BIBO2_0475 [Brucella sp. BO2]
MGRRSATSSNRASNSFMLAGAGDGEGVESIGILSKPCLDNHYAAF